MVMQLLERYLRGVKFWLPKDQKEDIIAELPEERISIRKLMRRKPSSAAN
jgi:hypothetical protein